MIILPHWMQTITICGACGLSGSAIISLFYLAFEPRQSIRTFANRFFIWSLVIALIVWLVFLAHENITFAP